VLSDCGHEVSHAINGKTGIDLLNNHPLPDVIILDMYLPVIGGREFKKRLEEVPAFAFIPVIGMSADIYGKKRCLSCGIDYFLQKPFELKELLEILDELADKSEDIYTHFRVA
jgi:CheY-like chemotaxis protein